MYNVCTQAFSDTQHHGCTQKGQPGRTGMQCCESTRSSFGCSFSCPSSQDCNFSDTHGALPDVVPYHNPYGGWPGDPSWGAAGAVIPREIVVTRGETATPELYAVVKSLVDFFGAHGDTKVNPRITSPPPSTVHCLACAVYSSHRLLMAGWRRRFLRVLRRLARLSWNPSAAGECSTLPVHLSQKSAQAMHRL